MLNYVEYGKENKYDDDIFFQKYSQMSRSQKGLAGAGEWETLKKMLPDFKGKRVLDRMRLWMALHLCDGTRSVFCCRC